MSKFKYESKRFINVQNTMILNGRMWNCTWKLNANNFISLHQEPQHHQFVYCNK